MARIKKTARLVAGIVLSCLTAVLAALALFWALVCFLGGPDGRVGSSGSLAFGSVFLLLGCGLTGLSVLGLRKIGSLRSKQ
ncbi:MAG: hypothetical protein ACI4R9_06685 [Kiritimatiellia bacterium]